MTTFKKGILLLTFSTIIFGFNSLVYPDDSTLQDKIQDNIGLRIGFLYTNGSLDVYGRDYKIPHYGLRIEYERGYELMSLPGLEFVAAISYLQIQAKDKFDADIDPTENRYDTPLNFEPLIRGTIIMSRIRYLYRTDILHFGFELGFGVGIFNHHLYWDFKEIGDSDIERDDSAKPVADWGLLFAFPIGERNKIGFYARGVIIPIEMQIAGTYDYGPYKVNIIGEFGLNWNVRF